MKKKGNNQQPIYPPHDWEIVEEKFCPAYNQRNETVFTLGNGYLGLRGNFEEGYHGPDGTSVEGTYINGFYETVDIKYPEIAYGYPEKGQTMLNVTNGKVIKLYLEDEEFHMFSGQLLAYQRRLDLRNGVLHRSLVWRSPAGREVKLEITRLVSFTNKHLAAIAYEVTPLNFDGKIRLYSALDGDVQNQQAGTDPRVGSHLAGRALEVLAQNVNDKGGALLQQTKKSGFYLACAMRNQVEGPLAQVKTEKTPLRVGVAYEFAGEAGRTIWLYKYLAYVTAKDEAHDLLQQAENLVRQAEEAGFTRLRLDQQEYMAAFWAQADIEVKGDPLVQQGLRFNAFHLLQAVGKDGITNIGAKGLTGEGYEGHYFWDTEIYILPFFTNCNPAIGRALLTYRYHTLDRARRRALEIGLTRGALYPWRTIGGDECSTFFPAGTAQYHINADIAYAIKKYVELTGDRDFLFTYGAEILFETARLWMEIGAFNPRKENRFCINVVTGPDEYTALVDNNCYTNLMAREHLKYAVQTAKWMEAEAPAQYQNLCAKIGLDAEEIMLWQKAAEHMYIPYDQRLGIYAQDDTFLDKPVWDLEATPPEKFPLLLHYHPLLIYRAQVCKQADVVLALFLLSTQFTTEEKRRNYDYYERITTHDSSLSPAIFSIVASEIGYHDKAYDYFTATVRLDLDDYHGNTKDGLHMACMAGSWLAVVYGFAGMRVADGVLCFAPYLPEQWEEYRFNVTHQGRIIRVVVNKEGTSYHLLKGDPLVILDHQEKRVLTTKCE
ncbi:glycoside hydrolase family 65 protein [Capillibacterium thermochitinicola]|uniref:Glycoside hydrolase family 65 protein n=1 Tax=Capillibacterium thermochitinicola TaxID=2699427 RepID=A0A8J6I443_9FIRM|nr:glycoside hydrolase family 65 protein [Capillibacterium thermochitinicola]